MNHIIYLSCQIVYQIIWVIVFVYLTGYDIHMSISVDLISDQKCLTHHMKDKKTRTFDISFHSNKDYQTVNSETAYQRVLSTYNTIKHTGAYLTKWSLTTIYLFN